MNTDMTSGTTGGTYCCLCSKKIYFRVDETRRLNIIGCGCGEKATPIDIPSFQPQPMTITQNICYSCASKDAELTRLRALATRWYLADGTYETLPEEEVIRRRIEAAGVLKRAEDVEKIEDIIEEHLAMTLGIPAEWYEKSHVGDVSVFARAVVAYLKGE